MIYRIIANEAVCEGVKEVKVSLRFDRKVVGGNLGSFSRTGIDCDDLGISFITSETLVKNGMCNC